MTMAQGMKRLGTPIAALLGLMLLGLIVSSWLINRDALREAVEAQIRGVTGLDLTPAQDRPPMTPVFWGFRVMFYAALLLFGSAFYATILRLRRKLWRA